ncbi:MAG TPA: pilus assembly PilX N-terminal domain-containing protein [Actinomycetota bacterium]|nr:pilus assembly PilX N-terminal domain-containing protein [Actinomycetota bacterium]
MTTFSLHRWVRRVRRDGEEGVALITVLLVTFVLLILVASTMAYAIGSMPISRRDQDWNAALTAAEAGLDDYLYRLNQNDQYYLYGSTPPPATGTCGAYPTLAAPPDGNAAFTSWVAVPGSTTGATFRYSVDTSCLVTQGAIIVWATGRSGNSTRTVQATFRRRAFIDYLYFTDYETTDPAAYPIAGYNTNNSAWAQANCASHYYETRPSGPPYDNSHCVDINFVSGDVINGPLHSNDAIMVCGTPSFQGNVTTSWQGAGTPVKRYRTNSGCSGNNPTFARAGDPKYADPLTMPPSNQSMKTTADATLAGTGCLFTGPTSITLNSNGTMTVVSPFTKWPAPPNNCQPGTNIPLPANGVIYVQNVPASSTDPNYSASCITSTQIGGTATVQQPLGYPQKYDISQYGCMNGDAFVKGSLKGRLSIAADNNIDVIGNLTYAGGTGGSDLLGLVANNFVEIYHPVGDCGSASAPCDNGSKVNGYYNLDDLAGGLTTSFNNPTIQAAILAVNHSFRVQNYQYGDDTPLGTITAYGAIAQKYRGTVGTGGASGYTKTYSYDQRMKYQSPPFFLNPVAAAWQIVTWIECKGTSSGSVPTTCQ